MINLDRQQNLLFKILSDNMMDERFVDCLALDLSEHRRTYQTEIHS